MHQLNRYLWITLVVVVMSLTGTQTIADQPDKSAAGDWIDLGGTIVSTNSDSFYLDYGEGLVMVKMDGWNWYEEARSLIDGDDVIVYGRMDDELIARETIEASSIYVKGLNTYYNTGAGDKEIDPGDITYSLPVVSRGHQISVTGTVSKIEGREFILNTGSERIRIHTSTMMYNPLDDVGYQQIRRGDRVSVAGRLQLNFFTKKEVEAEAVTSLVYDSKK